MSRARHIAVLCLLLAGRVLAQDDYALAYEKYSAGNAAGAREHIDRAVATDPPPTDPGVWLLRGFIYKDLFKAAQGDRAADPLRDAALTALATCMARDTARTYHKDARQAFEYLSKTYYNDAARALNESDPDRATQLFAKFKETTLQLDPSADMRVRDIEFLNALGTVHTKRYNQDRLDTTWFDKAVRTYESVLSADTANYGACYNLATLFYNRGVHNIQLISPDNSLPDLDMMQQVSRGLFLRALPFMLKAHRMNPKRKETLLGLEGIYYSLQNIDESERYRALYEALVKEEEEGK